ncbi:MAG: hypothetical protein JXB38_16555 [Anaerolineales bacterium]|nr:hypothetical protein [Anaerolineales bacterium]
MRYPRMAQLRTPQDFQTRLDELDLELGFDAEMQRGPDAPLAQSYTLRDGFRIGNRFCVQPMEGWDGSMDGKPSENTFRRWERFGISGAKLVWGGEATAVRHDGRANPHQLIISEYTLSELEALRQTLVDAHISHFGTADDLLIGLQLTHSGRFSRPTAGGALEPTILYHHPYLDEKYGLPPNYSVISDGEIEMLVADFVRAAKQAYEIGFQFVDLKHCHGYLGHEFLTAYSRSGKYGGSFENRTRFLREIVTGIRTEAPNLRIGVRLSAFDMPPFRPGADMAGEPVELLDERRYWFGAEQANPFSFDLEETVRFLELLDALHIELVNVTAGSPYYCHHIQRPALFPPSDGYQPPEDPLVGVARQIEATARLKAHVPNLLMVGTAYSYLQEWLPNVAQYVVRTGQADFIGLGRMMLSYPEMPVDILTGKTLQRKSICRTFSDCTTAPRNGLVSGCFPLDAYYKESPVAETLKTAKAQMKEKFE